MTTALELKAMLREEIAAPLDTPRIEGVTGELLAEYNEGYRVACQIVMRGNDRVWVEANRLFLGRVLTSPETQPGFHWPTERLAIWARGNRDAYNWVRAEFDCLESDAPVTAVEEEDGMIVVSRRDGTRVRLDMNTAKTIGDLAYNLALEETF